MRRLAIAWACAAGAAALTACSTPQLAMDQANNGVMLTQQLQLELQRFQGHSKASAERRLAIVQMQEANGLLAARERAFVSYLNQKSGAQAPEAASESLLNDAHNKFVALREQEDKSRRDLDARLASVAKELSAPSDKLGALQKTLAALGTELSDAERIAVVSKFLDESKKIVDKNVKAAAQAASAASAASPK